MKIFVPLKKHTVRIVPSLIITMLLSVSAQSSAIPAAEVYKTFHAESSDSIVVEKQVSSKKYKIKLYPDANQQVLFFYASGRAGKVFQLFVFDMDGRLVKQANIKSKQTTIINNIEKGIYLYQVFSDDERIENGKVTVR